MKYIYALEESADTFELYAESDQQALSSLLEICSKESASPIFLENSSGDVLWECADRAEKVEALREGTSIPLKKGETVSFQWKQGDKLYPVQGVIKRITLDWRSNNPAQKYLYQIRLDTPITITIPKGKLLVVKRTSMKNIEKIF